MVEHSGFAIRTFFLSEYANMILVSFLTSIFFVGGRRARSHGLGIPLLFGRRLVVAPPEGVLLRELLHLVPRFVPALPLRPDHAPGLEGLHSDHHRVDLLSTALLAYYNVFTPGQ